MKNQGKVIWVAVCLLVLICGFAPATGIYDHFDDGVLDSDWDVSFYNSTGWTYSEAGSLITVTGITIDDPGYDLNSRIYLSQNFNATGDFQAEFSFSWASGNTDTAIEAMRLELYSGGDAVVRAGYYDPWLYHRGSKFGLIGSTIYHSGENSLAWSGSAVVEIKRISGMVTILWDDNVLLSGMNSDAIDQLKMDFATNKASGATFDSLSIDYVSAIPEPASMTILALGMLILKKKRQ